MFWQPQFNKQFRQNIGTYLWSGKNTYPQHDADSDTSDERHHNSSNVSQDNNMMSLAEQMQALQDDITANPPRTERLAMLPQHQQQVQNLKDNLSLAYTNLEARTLFINLFETINIKLNLGLNHELQQSKNLHLQQLRKLEENKLCLQRADLLASKFTAALEMPSFVQPPASYQREQSLLDKKNIVRMITAFDDTNTNTTRSFKLVWSEILNFGRGEYLNEEEYKRILSVVLHGNIA